MKEELNIGCKNCNEIVTGKFCSFCGQKVFEPKDKKLIGFFEEFLSTIFVADGKVLQTFKMLYTKPGSLTKAFTDGATKKYLSPLKLFFFVNLMYFLFPGYNTFTTDLNGQLSYQSYSDFAKELVLQRTEESGQSIQEYRAVFDSKTNNLSKIMLVLLVVSHALILRVVFIRRKDLYLVDLLTASSYFNSFYILTCLIIVPFLLSLIPQADFLSEGYISILCGSISFSYLIFLLRRGFQLKIAKAIGASVIVTIMLVPIIILFRFLLFMVTYWAV